ncbi:MAG: transcriptional regulator, MarR family [Actinomycetia bacterium]|nr:transcriptional regulator, MarR family [Actinomycetes bacterium]
MVLRHTSWPYHAAVVDEGDLHDIESAIARISRVSNSRAGRKRIEDRSGIPLAQAAISTLSAVCRMGPARIGAIAEDVQLHQSRVSREVAKLVDAGFAEQLTDPNDGRATLVVATDKGRDARERYRIAAYEGVYDLLLDWPPDDVRRLAHLITKLADEFGTITDPQL